MARIQSGGGVFPCGSAIERRHVHQKFEQEQQQRRADKADQRGVQERFADMHCLPPVHAASRSLGADQLVCYAHTDDRANQGVGA